MSKGVKFAILALSLVVIGVLVITLWPAGKKHGVKLTVFDELARPDETIKLQAKLEHDGPLGINPDMRDYPLKFQGPPLLSEEVKTGKDGIASIQAKFPADTPSPFYIQVTFPGSKNHEPAEMKGRVFLWPEDAPILITDIDNTISDLPEAKVPVTSVADNPTLPGASDELTQLARTYRIVYLSARDDALYNKTQDWLKVKGFPDGPLFARDYHLGGSQEKFKTDFLAKLKKRYPKMVAGVGDKDSDAAAYLANDLKAFILDPKGEGRFPQGTKVVKSWKEVREQLSKDAPP